MHGGQGDHAHQHDAALLHHGMLLLDSFQRPDLLHTRSGGTPYGPSHLAGKESKLPLSDEESGSARALDAAWRPPPSDWPEQQCYRRYPSVLVCGRVPASTLCRVGKPADAGRYQSLHCEVRRKLSLSLGSGRHGQSHLLQAGCRAAHSESCRVAYIPLSQADHFHRKSWRNLAS